MAYAGNLICQGCGLTFMSRWGALPGADEYRCDHDHIVHVEPASGAILAVDGMRLGRRTLADLRGRCPRCAGELASGILPSCPVCGGRAREVLIQSVLR